MITHFSERWAVGLDVHARSVSAAAIDTSTGELHTRRLAPDPAGILAWIDALDPAAGPGTVAAAYEAGPTGFGLARAFDDAGIRCVLAAPSKIARAPGEHVKTDDRDAVLLARLLTRDDLAPVRVPTLIEEAARDLVRAREDTRHELMAARHRTGKLLLRHGIVYTGGTTWNRVHHAWLGQIRFDLPATTAAFDAALEAVQFAEARRDRLDEKIALMAADSPFTDITHRLACLRGISTLTAFALAVEIGDWTRFTGSSIGAFLGLTPSEHSSGSSRRQAGITKAGNPHARRLLIEAAWHHKPLYRVGATLQARWDLAPAPVRARAHEGNQRLHYRWTVMSAQKKKHTVATTAIARELAGWCWSLATLDPT
ncbi:IS110 family transposase [Xylanimonas sp. McL0601]|uniref:IS110 family transposase n=1 Tax=Xylanimonas sp. McL0601 TaxID=3414739 RepID=UPI003CFA98EA